MYRGKHLHGRGEDFGILTACRTKEETPPRTWRRRVNRHRTNALHGNTSTDVEKTHASNSKVLKTQKHLHGRGEDCINASLTARTLETPPRTWRRLANLFSYLSLSRNTSTDVEKTEVSFGHVVSLRKHLHGRGEDLRELLRESEELRNTSTDVEKTVMPEVVLVTPKKHLHGRGEDVLGDAFREGQTETPPRTWKRPRRGFSV